MQYKAGATCSIGAVVAFVVGMTNAGIRTTPEGLHLIGQFEGCLYQSYQCSADQWTAGVGHTGGVEPKMDYTDDEITKWFIEDIKEAERCVNEFGNGTSLNDNQFSAMTSLAFNVGCGAFRKGIVGTHLRQGRINEAGNDILRYVWAGDKKLTGLENRRKAEYALFNKETER